MLFSGQKKTIVNTLTDPWTIVAAIGSKQNKQTGLISTGLQNAVTRLTCQPREQNINSQNNRAETKINMIG